MKSIKLESPHVTATAKVYDSFEFRTVLKLYKWGIATTSFVNFTIYQLLYVRTKGKLLFKFSYKSVTKKEEKIPFSYVISYIYTMKDLQLHTNTHSEYRSS